MSGGFEDPSETGMLYGLTESISSDARASTKSYIDFTPYFAGQQHFKSRGSLFWRASVGGILLWLLLSLITYPWIGAFFCWRRNRRKKEQQNPR